MKKIFNTGPLLILIAACLWALDGVLRRSLYSLPPITIVFFEHLIGSIILLPVLITSLPILKTLSKKEWLNIAWISLFSGVLGTLWFTTALLKVNFISFSVVFLLQKLQPVFVIIAATAILKEKMTKQYMIWAGLSLIAAFFVTFPNGYVNLVTGAGTVTAALYALGAAFAWGTSTVFSKIALQTKPDKIVTTLRFFGATLISLLILVVHGQGNTLAMVTPSQLSRFLIIALSTGMVALFIYYKGLARTEAKVATILELIFPVSAVIIDAIVYKSLLTPTQYLAAAVLLFCAYKLSTARNKKVIFVSKKVKGKGRGKQMGFPTINLVIPKELNLRNGIYASFVTISGKKYQGALHYGPIPQFEDSQKSLEVYLLNVKNISEETVKKSPITVEIIQYIRPVMKFTSVEALIAQIDIDVQTTKSILS